MAKKQKKEKTVKDQKVQAFIEKPTLFERIEQYFDKRHHIVAILITLLSLVMSLLMFDAKVSTGYDDSTYVKVGYEYSKDFFNYFFTSQAPFYGMVLALPISILGINLIALKLINVLFFVLTVYVVYRVFRFKVSWLILFSALFIYATNSEALKYASLTYNETFYALVQAFFLFAILKLLSIDANQNSSIGKIFKENWLIFITVGVLYYFLFLTRTVGVAAIVAVVVYFISKKQYKFLMVTVASMILCVLVLDLIKSSIWSNVEHFSTQTSQGLQVDAYDKDKGYEDFNGMINRFLENTVLYFSARFLEILGLRSFPAKVNGGLAFLLIVPILVGLVATYKKQKFIYFSILFYGALLGFTFFAVQVAWGQGRYIMIFLPLIMMTYFWLVKNLFEKRNFKSYQIFGIGIILLFVFSNLKYTLGLTKQTIPIAKANLLKGDKYAGFTPDWVNYLKLSEWCGKNLPKGTKVACRKESMSFLYGNGYEFYPIYKAHGDMVPEEEYNRLKENGVTHVIIANLRVNVKSSTAGIINTMHRYMQNIITKYPNFLEEVRVEGTTETAVLYKINY